MKPKRVGLLIFPEFSEFEITPAISLLRGSHELICLSLTVDAVTSESGLTCLPTQTLVDTKPDELDALLIPGGDMVHLKDAETLFSFVAHLAKRGGIVAAICSGPYVLARAGVLTGRPYTVTYTTRQRSFLGCFDEYQYRYEPVVMSDNIITAQGYAFVAFGLAVAEQLHGKPDPETERFFKGLGNSIMEAEGEAT